MSTLKERLKKSEQLRRSRRQSRAMAFNPKASPPSVEADLSPSFDNRDSSAAPRTSSSNNMPLSPTSLESGESGDRPKESLAERRNRVLAKTRGSPTSPAKQRPTPVQNGNSGTYRNYGSKPQPFPDPAETQTDPQKSGLSHSGAEVRTKQPTSHSYTAQKPSSWNQTAKAMAQTLEKRNSFSDTVETQADPKKTQSTAAVGTKQPGARSSYTSQRPASWNQTTKAQAQTASWVRPGTSHGSPPKPVDHKNSSPVARAKSPKRQSNSWIRPTNGSTAAAAPSDKKQITPVSAAPAVSTSAQDPNGGAADQNDLTPSPPPPWQQQRLRQSSRVPSACQEKEKKGPNSWIKNPDDSETPVDRKAPPEKTTKTQNPPWVNRGAPQQPSSSAANPTRPSVGKVNRPSWVKPSSEETTVPVASPPIASENRKKVWTKPDQQTTPVTSPPLASANRKKSWTKPDSVSNEKASQSLAPRGGSNSGQRPSWVKPSSASPVVQNGTPKSQTQQRKSRGPPKDTGTPQPGSPRKIAPGSIERVEHGISPSEREPQPALEVISDGRAVIETPKPASVANLRASLNAKGGRVPSPADLRSVSPPKLRGTPGTAGKASRGTPSQSQRPSWARPSDSPVQTGVPPPVPSAGSTRQYKNKVQSTSTPGKPVPNSAPFTSPESPIRQSNSWVDADQIPQRSWSSQAKEETMAGAAEGNGPVKPSSAESFSPLGIQTMIGGTTVRGKIDKPFDEETDVQVGPNGIYADSPAKSLLEMAADSVLAVDYNQALTVMDDSFSATSSQQSNGVVRSVPLDKDLPDELQLRLTGEIQSGKMSPPVTPTMPSKSYSADASEVSPAELERIRDMNVGDQDAGASDAGSSSAIFGDPKTFGAAGGETKAQTPPVSERAKAIEGWRGGRAGTDKQAVPPSPDTNRDVSGDVPLDYADEIGAFPTERPPEADLEPVPIRVPTGSPPRRDSVEGILKRSPSPTQERKSVRFSNLPGNPDPFPDPEVLFDHTSPSKNATSGTSEVLKYWSGRQPSQEEIEDAASWADRDPDFDEIISHSGDGDQSPSPEPRLSVPSDESNALKDWQPSIPEEGDAFSPWNQSVNTTQDSFATTQSNAFDPFGDDESTFDFNNPAGAPKSRAQPTFSNKTITIKPPRKSPARHKRKERLRQQQEYDDFYSQQASRSYDELPSQRVEL